MFQGCLTCQQIKAEHQRPRGLLQPLDIPEWKWECITMDFVSGLPRTFRKHDAIWVIVDRLTKSAHFLPINMTYSLDRLADLYVDEIEDFMVSQRRSSRTETPYFFLDCGGDYKILWAPK